MKCECGKDHSEWVEKSKLVKAQEDLRSARSDLAASETRAGELEGQLGDAGKAGKQVQTLTAQLEEWQAKGAAWDVERAVMRAGITDEEGAAVVPLLYNRLAPEDRPKGGITEWLGNRDALPKAVQAYLPAANEGGQEATGAESTTSASASSASSASSANQQGAGGAASGGSQGNTGARSFSGAPQGFAPGSVGKMSREEYAANRSAIWGGRPPKPPAGVLGANQDQETS